MAEGKIAFGADVGGTTVKLGLYDVDKEQFTEKWEIPTRTQDEGKAILPDIALSLQNKIEQNQIDTRKIMGVGIVVPGPVLDSRIVNQAVNLHWGVMDVTAILSDLLGGLPVKVANDARGAALGEQWKGAGREYQNMVMVTLGTGVGGGIILNGKIAAGSHGAGGEIGHIKVNDTETVPCNCGKCGCLEQYASATGVVRMTRKAMQEKKVVTSLKDDDSLTCQEVFDEAKKGDAFALSMVNQFGKYLGEALASIAEVVDPEAFVIGGGVSKAGQIILDVIQRYYKPAAFHACRDAAFCLAELGNDAGIYGAVRLILQQ